MLHSCKLFIWTTLSVITVILLATGASSAVDFSSGFSLQGYTGIMNTPTANVQKEGTMGFWYAKQRDSSYPYQHEENYLFSLGIFSFLEAGGRVATSLSPSSNNDVSAQFKFSTAPFTPKKYPWIPTFAVGAQDVGGSAHFYQSTYLVATEEVSRLRVSLGYGFGPDRMKGLFSGVELKAFDWLYLLGEYDAKDTNIGARVVSPELFGYPVNLQASIKSALNNNPGNINFTAGVQFALGKDWHRQDKGVIPTSNPADQSFTGTNEAAPVKAATLSPVSAAAVTPTVIDERQPLKSGAEAIVVPAPVLPIKAGAEAIPSGTRAVAFSLNDSLLLLRDKLVSDGFMHVRIGANSDDLLVIEYENGRYTQNQLDGMGVALGMVIKYIPAEFKTVRLILKVQNIKMLQVTIPSTMLQSFFNDAAMTDTVRDFVAVSYVIDDDRGVNFVEEKSFSSWFRTRLTLAPRLKTFIATEIRPLDHLLSFAPSLSVDLWKGALVNATADIPFSWSSSFDTGEPFRGFRNDPQLQSLMLTQALRPRSDLLISLSGGMISNQIYGMVNEAYWYSKEGDHRLGFQQGFGAYRDSNYNHATYLGSYRYNYTPLDTSLMITGGSFWNYDTGLRADLTRFWGDTSLSLYYKLSRTSRDENYQVGGIQIAFPLTPRQGMKPYPVQVKGTDEWKYHIQTVTKSPSGANSVFVSIGDAPPVDSSTTSYYDRDRLTPEYVKSHLLRLRDAYIRYVKPD